MFYNIIQIWYDLIFYVHINICYVYAIGPGPVYKLRPLVGYEDHCPSRHRNPAYSMRHRTPIYIPSVGPGPQYDVSRLTNYGPDNPPAYTIACREPFKCEYAFCNSVFLIIIYLYYYS